MTRQPRWDIEGRDWPLRDASRFVMAGGLTWHVQVMGQGPVLLLLHGTGAATHSWRGLAPLLSPHFTLVAPDLPGHGFTELPSRRHLSLPGIASSVARLLAVLDVKPDFVTGHSAGAAIGLRMALDGAIKPAGLVSLNGALLPFPGLGALVYPALAKLLFLNPLAGPLLAQRAGASDAIAKLLAGTGSYLDAEGLDLYRRLLNTTRHVEAALGMMANWDLRPLQRDWPRLDLPLTLVAAEGDKAVPPSVATKIAALAPRARAVMVPGLGHLAHEEDPARFAELIRSACV